MFNFGCERSHALFPWMINVFCGRGLPTGWTPTPFTQRRPAKGGPRRSEHRAEIPRELRQRIVRAACSVAGADAHPAVTVSRGGDGKALLGQQQQKTRVVVVDFFPLLCCFFSLFKIILYLQKSCKNKFFPELFEIKSLT